MSLCCKRVRYSNKKINYPVPSPRATSEPLCSCCPRRRRRVEGALRPLDVGIDIETKPRKSKSIIRLQGLYSGFGERNASGTALPVVQAAIR